MRSVQQAACRAACRRCDPCINRAGTSNVKRQSVRQIYNGAVMHGTLRAHALESRPRTGIATPRTGVRLLFCSRAVDPGKEPRCPFRCP
ncbi:hypothetical protein C7S13_8204 [Burkholderia cepacia]|nr:hypothetical protein [Burkholderia cepacia]